jgi:DNA-binding NtrC family response regulator
MLAAMKRDDPLLQSTHPCAPTSVQGRPTEELALVYPPALGGERYELEPGTVFGRSPDDGVTAILNTTVSRRHAAVQSGLGGVLYLADLESRNGTRVDGQRSELPLPLGRQAVVRLGDVLGVIDAPSDATFEDGDVLPGRSPAMRDARRLLERAASDHAPVLVLGETGAGKERVAREIHERSGRLGEYVALSCAELSPELIESELFGHERGAFTGAGGAKPGLFMAAHGGTLFLDEIGELPLDLQSKLLRVLQEGEVRPLGSTRTQRVDVRVVAATNRDLPALAETAGFRRDLYARLAFWELRLPPLRERRQDILEWVGLLLARWNDERHAETELQFLPDAAERLLLHPWHDNLRGLARLVHRLASIGAEQPIGLRMLALAMPELGLPREAAVSESAPPPATSATAPPQKSVLPTARPNVPTRDEFLAAYEQCGRSVRATAKHFGRDRRQIYRWLDGCGIPRDSGND